MNGGIANKVGGNWMTIFASDLDNTLIFSYKKKFQHGICVEQKDGKALSYMTPRAYQQLQDIVKQMFFLPVTTRSEEQYRRIRLLKAGDPSYALVSNGGTLLVNGKVDALWRQQTLAQIENCREDLERALEVLQQDPFVTTPGRLVDEVFVFAKTSHFARTAASLTSTLNLQRVKIERHGEKLYVLPLVLSKGNALQRFCKRLQREVVVAAGDSIFDLSMLLVADVAIAPAGSMVAAGLAQKAQVFLPQGDEVTFGEMVLEYVQNVFIK